MDIDDDKILIRRPHIHNGAIISNLYAFVFFCIMELDSESAFFSHLKKEFYEYKLNEVDLSQRNSSTSIVDLSQRNFFTSIGEPWHDNLVSFLDGPVQQAFIKTAPKRHQLSSEFSTRYENEVALFDDGGYTHAFKEISNPMNDELTRYIRDSKLPIRGFENLAQCFRVDIGRSYFQAKGAASTKSAGEKRRNEVIAIGLQVLAEKPRITKYTDLKEAIWHRYKKLSPDRTLKIVRGDSSIREIIQQRKNNG